MMDITPTREYLDDLQGRLVLGDDGPIEITAGDIFVPRLEWLDTDLVSRHAESQIRARSDPELVAAYAHAMLQGAEFPPIVVFQDGPDSEYHLGDGHHRIDAATLAATKDPNRSRRIEAEIRRGGFDDALRWAMRANSTHGKRLDENDYRHAVEIALKRNLIQVKRASEVVPALVDLIPGLSARWARDCSVDYRKTMNAKRDRLIAAMAAEGKTQEQIAAALDVPQRTVSDVLVRLSENGGTAETAKPPEIPDLFAEDEDDQGEEPPPAIGDNQPKEPVRRYDFSSYLRLLEPFELSGSDEDDSGAVGDLVEPAVDDNPQALAALALIDGHVTSLVGVINGALAEFSGPISKQSTRSSCDRLHAVADYLKEAARYLAGGR